MGRAQDEHSMMLSDAWTLQGPISSTLREAREASEPRAWPSDRDLSSVVGLGAPLSARSGSRRATAPLAGKKLAFSGDSITFGYDEDRGGVRMADPWVDQVGRMLGAAACVNYGVSSATLIDGPDSTHAILRAFPAYDDDVDVIGFLIGINDSYFGHPLGTPDDGDATTYCGGLNLLCRGAVEKWRPADGKLVFLMTYPKNDQPHSRREDVRFAGLTGWDAWNEAIRHVARRYSFLSAICMPNWASALRRTRATSTGTAAPTAIRRTPRRRARTSSCASWPPGFARACKVGFAKSSAPGFMSAAWIRARVRRAVDSSGAKPFDAASPRPFLLSTVRARRAASSRLR